MKTSHEQAQAAWQSVLTQLQSDMPRASFDTWVRDTQAVSLAEGTLTVSARNAYARDWLEARLVDCVQPLLAVILKQKISVRFVAREAIEDELDSLGEEAEAEVAIEPVQWLDYDRIVEPHKQVVVKGYLRRLGMEIGPKAVWLYIGFHQAAWRVHAQGREGGLALHSREVRRFSGLSFGAFWRLLRHAGVQADLRGLVQRVDPPQERRYHRGRDGRPHRVPIRYQVCMTPRLTRADAAAVHARLKSRLKHGLSISDALQELLAVPDVAELLGPVEGEQARIQFNTIMDMARREANEAYTPEVDRLAQALQRRIINSLGDIHIPHYFITGTIRQFDLTPAQAWLVTVARDMAYLNSRTGERREMVTFKRGYREMAELVGSPRYKTVQAWLNPGWALQQRGGDLTRFLVEVEPIGPHSYSDLRVEDLPRSFRVELDEPLDANGSHKLDANGTHMADANGSHRWTQMEGIVDANGSHMLDANGTDLNTYQHPSSTSQKNTPTTQHGEKAAGAAPAFWELEVLLQQNDVHPKVQRELLEAQASVHALVSWVLYVASPASGNLSDPLGYALSRLREHPLREARGIFRQLADLPPAELLMLIDSTPARAYEIPTRMEHPLAAAWKKAMGSNNPRLPAVRAILFTEGACE
ncbi:MAG: hypothetical protein HY869_08915 [Chloroflexi bacterium]|nr:hypothetical protein [Chloroflexota bacterium]